MIISSLRSIGDKRAQRQDEEDELFGRQVGATLRRRQKSQAKLRIQQILMDVEFPDEQANEQYGPLSKQAYTYRAQYYVLIRLIRTVLSIRYNVVTVM